MATGNDITIRTASIEDLSAVIGMLTNDPLGQHREDADSGLNSAYLSAFNAIDVDPNNQLLVATSGTQVVGVLQLTFIPNLTYTGGLRAQIEGVRVHESVRGQGVGKLIVAHAIEQARGRNCVMVQLTTDKRRPDALAFYESSGFAPSHEGMKLLL